MGNRFWGCFDGLLDSPVGRWIGREPVSLALPAGTHCVRIEAANPIPLPMHIACVHFFDSGGRWLPQALDVAASSTWAGSPLSAAEQCAQFIRNPYGSGLHTALEDEPCIELRFSPLDRPAQMVMFNRTDLWAWRNEWLRVVAQGTDGAPRVLLDVQSQARAWLARLACKTAGRDPRTSVRQRLALDLIEDLLLGDPALAEHPEAVDTLWNVRFERLQNDFQAAVDYRLDDELQQINRLAAMRRLEVGAHGVTRTFRYLSMASKAALIQRAADVCDALQALGLRACAGYGTALGLVRGGDLIAHDDDLDLHAIVPAPGDGSDLKTFIARECCRLVDALGALGFSVLNKQTHVKVRCEHNFDAYGIDVFPTLESDGDLRSAVNHKGPVGSRGSFAIGSCLYGRVALPMPEEGAAYCEGVYGPDWRTPVSRYEHSWA